MKKVMLAVAIVCAAVCAQAASVGWTLTAGTGLAGNKYMFFVDGQNGATLAAVTAALDAGTDVSAMSFGSGVVADNGVALVAAASSGKTLTNGASYTGFYVVFDSATPAAGAANYAVVAGASGLTKAISATAASVTFVGGNQSTALADASNWKSFGGGGGDVPEPTSGLLLLIGGAMLALRRKQK